MISSAPRRRFLSRSLLFFTGAVTLAACRQEATSGLVDIDWGRERDARCNMMIVDRLFAAEVRDSAGKLWKFDDIGCAIVWLEQHGGAGKTATFEVWVKDHETGEWLDARRARYVHGVKSPMRYQFGATAKTPENGIGYEELRQRILALSR